ncbi:hypothetical protein SAMN05421736_104251 [Evansella caseinilytica]|uniref:Uncharacterized protein n=1 Tax=Evansella caseinilytica TaxID=1503961 RepID=A0A1H3NXQ1_9BACI|nr:hypothetical protein [Evansella caseinilytica]SDY93664.1 hypothetical protein SAMN05421736_104251 [Evansella caseinilytica]
MTSEKKQLKVIIEQMETLFDGFFEWLAGQYDAASGGFYYARSSVESQHFTPDIESTAQALNILIRNELLDKMPGRMKQEMVSFFRNKQDGETGCFYDEHPAMRKDEVMVHRAFQYASGALRKLRSEPLYPLSLKANAIPKYAETPQSYLEKWKSIDLSNSWRGCDLLAASCNYIHSMEPEKRQPFLEEALRYLDGIQDPETGLWGGGSLYVRISGTFKLHSFYRRYQLPLPRKERIYQSILTCLRTETAADMCYIRNPIHLLSYMQQEVPYGELQEILEITTQNMTMLKRQDGGFSRELEHSPPAPNVAQVKAGETYPEMPEAVCLSDGLVEGDMNASTQATLIWQQCLELCGLEAKPISGAADFYSFL